jgi:DNA methyltransferase 1-associated protein 1
VALEALFARGKEDEAAEDAILEQAKVIEAKRRAEASARRPAPVGAPSPAVICELHLNLFVDQKAQTRPTNRPTAYCASVAVALWCMAAAAGPASTETGSGSRPAVLPCHCSGSSPGCKALLLGSGNAEPTAAVLPATAAPPPDFVATSEFPDDPGPGVSSLFDADVQPAREAPGVYARGVHTAAAAEKQLSRLAAPPKWVSSHVGAHNMSSLCTVVLQPVSCSKRPGASI